MTHRKQSTQSATFWSKLDAEQRGAVEFAERVKTAALLCEQRTGKTYITLGLIERLADASFSALLVVPLTNVETTWARLLGDLTINVARTLDSFKAMTGPKVLLMHYEAVAPLIERLRRLHWSLIVYDESQRLKARGTLQSRTAAKLRYSAERKLILTGTPMEARPNDMWAQFRFLNPNAFGTRWKDYEERFLEQPPQEQLDKLKKAKPGTFRWHRLILETRIFRNKRKFLMDKLPEFLELIEPYTLRITKEAVGIERPTIQWEPVMLRGRQREIYRSVERDLFVRVKNARITAPMKVTQIGKLQQICGGYVFDDDGEVHEVGRAKLRRVLWLAKHQSKPLVIFCRYREEVRALAERLSQSWRVETLTGLTKNRKEVINNFQRKKVDILVAQERTGGVGIDLYAADVAIFFSVTYSFIDFDQALSRIQVRGSTNAKKIFLVYAEQTIDEVIYNSILSKRKVIDLVLETLMKGNDMAKDTTFGINDFAKELGVLPATARVGLRKIDKEKDGRAYVWNSRDAMRKDVDAVRKSGGVSDSKKTAKAGKAKAKAGGKTRSTKEDRAAA